MSFGPAEPAFPREDAAHAERAPFEVVGELTMQLGPEPPPERMTVQLGHAPIGEWDDPNENPLQAVARLQAEVIRKNNELLAAHAEAATLRDSVRDEAREVHRTRSELDAFRDQVREVAIRVADEQSWCTAGLNEVLDELGLDRKTTRFRVPVTVVAKQHVWVEVEAESEEDAEEQVTEEEIDEQLDGDEWEITDWSKTDWSSVEPIRER